MSEPWYQVIAAVQPISQGDLILDCPVLMWKRLDPAATTPALADRASLLREDVVVMTQACDQGDFVRGKGDFGKVDGKERGRRAHILPIGWHNANHPH